MKRYIFCGLLLVSCGGESFGSEDQISDAGTDRAGTGGVSGSAGKAGSASGGKSGASTGGSGGIAGSSGASGGAGLDGSGGTEGSGSGGSGGNAAGAAGAAGAPFECPGPAKWDGPPGDLDACSPCEPWICGTLPPNPLKYGTECSGAPCCKTFCACGHNWGNGCE